MTSLQLCVNVPFTHLFQYLISPDILCYVNIGICLFSFYFKDKETGNNIWKEAESYCSPAGSLSKCLQHARWDEAETRSLKLNLGVPYERQ